MDALEPREESASSDGAKLGLVYDDMGSLPPLAYCKGMLTLRHLLKDANQRSAYDVLECWER